MRTLYFDCFSGISGDMTLGALIDCGIDFEEFKTRLEKLHIGGYSIEMRRSMKNGISGTDINVILEDDHEHEGHHHHRNLMDIEHIIDMSELSDRVKQLSKIIFRRLAEAEAKIHDMPVEEVHFHEVGAVDSIIDIVGTAICIDMLEIDTFVSSPINTGMGFVKCQHGIIPVPGPAALELLKGIPIYSEDVNTELITPTGAAIIAVLCNKFGPIPEMTVESVGYGCGKKELDIPNLLRVMIGECKKKPDEACMIECNIDDMNSEFYEYAAEKLFKAGALDVFLTNIIMKKGRPAVKLSVLAKFEDVDNLSDIIFKETSTIGIRKYPVEREVLERKIIPAQTKCGMINVKAAFRGGIMVNYAPEYEDVKNVAAKSGMSIKEIYNQALKSIDKS